MSSRAHVGFALIAALSFAAGVRAQNATPATAAAKPQCTVSDVPAGATVATPSAFPAPAARTPDKKPAPPALAEDVRKAIFIELQQIVARAQREASVAYPAGDGGVQLECDGGRGDSDRDARLVDNAGESPDARTGAVVVVGLRAEVAPRRLDAGLCILPPAVVPVVTPEHRVLAALFVDEDDVDDDARVVRPFDQRRRTSIADEVAH